MNIKIGILSDTHLREVTRAFREIYERYLSDKDVVLHAGDVVSIEIIDFLSRKRFYGVHGNMDPFEVKERLPRKKIIEFGKFRMGLVHGGGPSAGLEDRVWSEFGKVDIIVYGHSHQAANHTREGVLLFNPGTATGFSSSGVHTIGILEVNQTIRSKIILL
jgi:putative phosphoesterase